MQTTTETQSAKMPAATSKPAARVTKRARGQVIEAEMLSKNIVDYSIEILPKGGDNNDERITGENYWKLTKISSYDVQSRKDAMQFARRVNFNHCRVFLVRTTYIINGDRGIVFNVHELTQDEL